LNIAIEIVDLPIAIEMVDLSIVVMGQLTRG
jgi:hypothetical protein